MYFNIEINILDAYSVECEKVHVLVFINYWIEKCTVKHWNFSTYFYNKYKNLSPVSQTIDASMVIPTMGTEAKP